MAYQFARWAHGLKVGLLSLLMCLTSGCHSAWGDDVKATFLWGPVNETFLDDAASETITPFAPESHAAQLREELLAPVNRYAPSDKDWRFVRGNDKGPTIFGARLAIGLGDQGHTQLRLGAVKRGSNRTFGPQLIFNFGD